jgi:hypothetical protein
MARTLHALHQNSHAAIDALVHDADLELIPFKSLEDRIQYAGGPVAMMRDSPALTLTGPLTGAEVSNWRDEETGPRGRACRH